MVQKYKFPRLPRSKFDQLYEVCSIHAAKKGLNSICYSRREEVDNEELSDIEAFEDYRALIREPLEDLEVFAKRVSRRPAGYRQLEGTNVLPEWPGTKNILC